MIKKYIIAILIILFTISSQPVYASFCGYLRADTATDIKIGPFLDSTNGNDAEDGLTLTQADIRLSKNGSNFAQTAATITAVHDELGYYDASLETTDTNTEGRLVVVIHKTGGLLVEQRYEVVNANVYDSLYAAATTDYLQTDLTQILDHTLTNTGTQLADAFQKFFDVAAPTATCLSLPDAVPDAAGGLPISDAGGLDLDIALKKGMFESGKVYIDAAGTNNTAWPYGSAPYPTTTIANGKTISDANAIDYFICHGDLALSAAMENYTFTGHSHNEIAHRINIETQSVEHSTFIDIVVQGTMTNATGVLNITRFKDCKLWALADIHGIASDGGLDGALSVLNGGIFVAKSPSCGALAACTLDINTPAVCIISDMFGTLTVTGMDGGGTASISIAPGGVLTLDNSNTAGTINVSGDLSNFTDNSTGATVNEVYYTTDAVQIESGDASDALDTASATVTVTAVGANVITDAACADDIQVDVKTIETGDATDALDTAANTVTVTSIGANIITAAAIADAAIDNDTFAADVGTTAHATNHISLAARKGLDDYDPPTDTEMDNALDALNDLSEEQINTEVKDVLYTDTMTELGIAAPSKEPSIADGLMLLYMDKRNKTITDSSGATSEYRMTNDAGTVITECNIADDGVAFTKDELGAVD